jgi:hypothetical protein
MSAEGSKRSIACTGSEFTDLSLDLLKKGCTLRFQARGTSMLPWIRNGDILTVAPTGMIDVQLGDVVLFQSGSGAIRVHRVIKQGSGARTAQFLVKGDRLLRTDGWIPAAQVFGRVIAVERNGRCIERGKSLARWAQRLWTRLGPLYLRCLFFVLSARHWIAACISCSRREAKLS